MTLCPWVPARSVAPAKDRRARWQALLDPRSPADQPSPMRNIQLLALLLILPGCAEKPLTPDELRAALRPSEGLTLTDIKSTRYGLLTRVQCVEDKASFSVDFEYRIWSPDYRKAESVGDVGGFLRSVDEQMQMMCLCLQSKRDGHADLLELWQPKCDDLMAKQKSRVEEAK